ncbi:hypothetical protein B9Z55_023310 [Caenorhabditis nigoni]|uniref:Uncharacterized protein n=1 Tax=Caenorhabditis nigoni TaxID=1611254 RepID=A0A2G5SPD9_9PELO|nr:hypothetical protein B9Z55_023310 [Caenorhabditis nigoni]
METDDRKCGPIYISTRQCTIAQSRTKDQTVTKVRYEKMEPGRPGVAQTKSQVATKGSSRQTLRRRMCSFYGLQAILSRTCRPGNNHNQQPRRNTSIWRLTTKMDSRTKANSNRTIYHITIKDQGPKRDQG